jgi:hypothetical protein
MEGASEVDVVLLRHTYTLRNSGLAIAAAGAIIGLSVSGDARILSLVGLLFIGGFLALLGIEGTPQRIDARLDELGVRVADRIVGRRRSFRAGWIERDRERTCVHVDGVRPALRLEARDVADARRLLRLLGLDGAQTVLRFRSYSSAVWMQLVAQVALQSTVEIRRFTGVTLAQIALWALFVVALWVVTFFSIHGETIIGADGVLFRGRLRRRFVPFSEIASVDCEGSAKLVVRTRDGTTFTRSLPAPAAQAALEAIQGSLASVGGTPEALRRRLRRSTSDEDPAVWLGRVRALAAPVSYRAAGLAAEVLWQVIDDPGASPSERAAAAVALDVNATQAERQRLHEVAARIASPQVRVAIEHVAARWRARSDGSGAQPPSETGMETPDGDDGPLAAALARISDGRSSA